jgi:hypothetical protein
MSSLIFLFFFSLPVGVPSSSPPPLPPPSLSLSPPPLPSTVLPFPLRGVQHFTPTNLRCFEMCPTSLCLYSCLFKCIHTKGQSAVVVPASVVEGDPTLSPDKWRVVVFGGRDTYKEYYNDLWSFDPGNWGFHKTNQLQTYQILSKFLYQLVALTFPHIAYLNPRPCSLPATQYQTLRKCLYQL